MNFDSWPHNTIHRGERPGETSHLSWELNSWGLDIWGQRYGAPWPRLGVQTHVQTHTHAHADIQSHTHKHYKCTQYHTNIETAICKNQNSHIKHNFLRYLRNSETITETEITLMVMVGHSPIYECVCVWSVSWEKAVVHTRHSLHLSEEMHEEISSID